jgi:hypothetical protein
VTIAGAIKANYRPSAERVVGTQLPNIIRSIAVLFGRQSLILATEMNKLVR